MDDLETIIQSEVNQKEKNKFCTWNLEKWYRWTSLQGKNRDTDVENRFVGMMGVVVGWIGKLELTYTHYHM